jgi:colanic acid/amylovoran biosynthesis glycosyltransferase
MSVGRLHWKKGLNYVIEALAELNNKGYEFSYSIIGTGVDYERIAFLAYQNGILDKINVLGEINHDEISKHLNKTNYFIQYSVQEGFGNAVLEAQASGLISIVSDAEGLSENVCDGETGFVVPKLKPKLLARQIIETHKLSTIEKQKISDSAISRVKELFQVNSQIDAFENFYK